MKCKDDRLREARKRRKHWRTVRLFRGIRRWGKHVDWAPPDRGYEAVGSRLRSGRGRG